MMKRVAFFVTLFATIVLIGGCSQQSNPVDNSSGSDRTNLSSNKIIIPENATLESATLYIYSSRPNSEPINVHRITADWDETVVTWNSFGGAFDAEIFGTFTPAAVDWNTVDITSLIQGWLDGSFANYGLLLDQVEEVYPRAIYYSRESMVFVPYLEVCYSVDGAETCEETESIADTYIWETNPDMNFGTRPVLYTGWEAETDMEKQSLIMFEIETTPVETASIGDFVWHDMNQDGIQDEGEAGIEGVTVNLYDCEDNLLATTTTDADGLYLFSDLTPGDYYVGFELPAGYAFSPQDQGTDDALDSDADTQTGMTMCTTLEADEHDLTWDAGLYMPIVEEYASLGDFVWHDMNMDGIQDEGEEGIEGVTVNLYDCEDNLLASTTTDADGFYLFSDLTPGDYYVGFEAPAGYVFSPQDQGTDDALDSDADPQTGMAACTTLETDEHDMTWDAGLYMPIMEGCTRTIGYWKNYAGFGPQDDMVTALLPIWLGNDDGDMSKPITDAGIAVAVLEMKTWGKPNNGITKLYAQLLGAKLNIASGADYTAIADYIDTADDFLADHDWHDWHGLSEENQQMVLDWARLFDDYNNGYIGPGHCDDIDDMDDDD